MTVHRSYVLAMLVAMLSVWTTGCLEHQVKTTINTDGSCERTITLNADSKKVPATSFPLPTGKDWDTSWAQAGDARFAVSFSKRFRDFDGLMGEYTRPIDSMKIHLTLSVNTSFRWFYTYYHYTEAYGRFTDYTLVDPQTVLTEEEIRMLTYGDTSKTLVNKKDEWVARNLFEALHRRFARGAEVLRDTLLTPANVAAHKEELFRTLVGYAGPGLEMKDPENLLRDLSSYRGTRAEMFSESGVTDEGLNAFAEIAARILKSDATWKLKDSVRAGWQDVLTMVGGKGTQGESFTNEVILPGILLETNAPEVKGSTVSWKFTVHQLALREYEMHARSRVMNEWAVAVTAVLVLALLGLLVFSLVRNARRSAKP